MNGVVMMALDDVEAAERRDAPDLSEVSWALREVNRRGGQVDKAVTRRLGIGHNETLALDVLLQSPVAMGPVELGNILGIRSASATALVDRLEASGHVRRVRHPTDRRRLIVETTETARRDVLAVLAPLLADVDEIAAGLTDDEAAVVTGYLRRVATAMRRFSEG